MTGSDRPTIVKLGGSVITRKRGTARARPKIVARLAGELAGARSLPLVLLHGAGSFGHPGAVRFGLSVAPSNGPSIERTRGAAIVQAEVRRLHGKLLAALIDAGANPISVPASTHAANRAGRLARFDPVPFVAALTSGALPVSFGDVVPDEEWGFSILSADRIAVELARTLPAQRVVFVSDVPGVLEPGRIGRPLVVPTLDRSIVDRLPVRGAGPDVTGGIRAKVEAILEIASAGVDAGLISGLSDGRLSRAIRGESVYGSWATAAPP